MASRLQAFKGLSNDCFRKQAAEEGAPTNGEDTGILEAMKAAAPGLGEGNGSDAAAELFALARKRTRWKLYRNELWRDAERAAIELSSGRSTLMVDAASNIRLRVSNTGRKLPKRTVSTPLLLKGLEFDHVVIPDATHFARERYAQAKLFYVAISRATQSLTISSSSRVLSFSRPLA